MGDFNQSVILEAIRRSVAGLSRIELAQVTGLSAQAVTNITRRLMQLGLVVEAGRTITGPGKPRTILKLDASRRFAVGVHLDPAVMTFVVLDLAGELVSQAHVHTPVGSATHIIEAIASGIEAVITESGIDRARVAGVGVASPGPIDAALATIVDPPKLLGWHRVPLKQALSDASGLPVHLEKDTTAAAVAELWRETEHANSSFVFVYLGTGIGAGFAMQYEVIRGSSHNAGEIGHIVVDRDGPPCACGQRGCLDVVCTPQAMVEKAERLGVLQDSRVGSDAESVDERFRELCARSHDGDTRALAVLEDSAAQLSVAIAVLTNMLDVDRVIFGGPYWTLLSEAYMRIIPARIYAQSATRALRSVPVSGAISGEDVAAIGAACVVLDEVYSPRASTLYLDDAVPEDANG